MPTCAGTPRQPAKWRAAARIRPAARSSNSWAHEWGGKAAFYVSPPGRTHQHALDLYFKRYVRTNNLSVNVLSIGYGYTY